MPWSTSSRWPRRWADSSITVARAEDAAAGPASRRGGSIPALLLWGFVLICAAGVVLEPLLAQLPDLSLNVGRGLWTLLMLVLFAPVLEELICRGLVLGTLRARYGVTLAWLVSALFFGVMHLQPVQVINAFVVGLILGYVYISTDSLWS